MKANNVYFSVVSFFSSYSSVAQRHSNRTTTCRVVGTVENFVGSVFHLPENVASKMIFDFTVSWNWLTSSSSRVLIPIMSPAVSDEDRTALFKLPD